MRHAVAGGKHLRLRVSPKARCFASGSAMTRVDTSTTSFNFCVNGIAPNNPTRKFLPPNALSCTGMGKQFYAPPQFNLNQVVGAGQAGGRFNLSAMNSAVGHFGAFDYQRVGTPSSFTF